MSGVEGQLLPLDECSDDEMLIESFIHNQPNYFDGIVARQISNLLPSKPHKQERKRLKTRFSTDYQEGNWGKFITCYKKNKTHSEWPKINHWVFIIIIIIIHYGFTIGVICLHYKAITRGFTSDCCRVDAARKRPSPEPVDAAETTPGEKSPLIMWWLFIEWQRWSEGFRPRPMTRTD